MPPDSELPAFAAAVPRRPPARDSHRGHEPEKDPPGDRVAAVRQPARAGIHACVRPSAAERLLVSTVASTVVPLLESTTGHGETRDVPGHHRSGVFDECGRAVHGRLEELSADGVSISAGRLETVASARISRIRSRERDSIKNGTLVGLGVSAAMETARCAGAIADDSGDVDARVECADGATVFPALGALLGALIDRLTPGLRIVIYGISDTSRGPGTGCTSRSPRR